MTEFNQQIINGLILGGVYSLFAVGLTLSLGVQRVMNTAHGATLAFAAVACVEVARKTQLNFWEFLLVGAAAGALIGALLEIFCIRPLRFAAGTGTIEMPSLVSTLAALFMLQAVTIHWTEGQLVNTPLGIFNDRLIFWGDYYFRYIGLVTFGLAILLMLIVWLVVNRTQSGRAIRAIAMDEDATSMLGINANVLKFVTTTASGVLAGIAGALLALSAGAVDYQTGTHQLLRGFCVVILGGIGSVSGALVGGLLLGVAEGLTIYWFGTSWQAAAAFVILILFLMFRPQGIFGKPEVDRA